MLARIATGVAVVTAATVTGTVGAMFVVGYGVCIILLIIQMIKHTV